MTREYLKRQVMTEYGWRNLQATSSVADLVRRNMEGEISQSAADALKITFANTA